MGEDKPKVAWRPFTGLELRQGEPIPRSLIVVEALFRVGVVLVAALGIMLAMAQAQAWVHATAQNATSQGVWLHEERVLCIEKGCTVEFEGAHSLARVPTQRCVCYRDALLRQQHRRYPIPGLPKPDAQAPSYPTGL